jgi:hypothetical protein
MNSAELETEIHLLEERRTKLQREHWAATSAHEETRSQLLSVGGKRSVDAATATGAKEMVLREVLDTLDSQIEQKHRALAELQSSEQRAAQVGRCARLAEEGNAALRDYEQARAEANESLKAATAKMLDAHCRMASARSGFLSEASPLAPGIVKLVHHWNEDPDGKMQAQLDTLLRELGERGVALTAVALEWFGGRTMIDQNHQLPAVEPFQHLISDAFRLMVRHRQQDVEQSAKVTA